MTSTNSSFEVSFDSFDALDVSSDSAEPTCRQNEGRSVPNDFIDEIMMYFLRHNLTLVALEDLMKLLNRNRDQWNQFPTSKKTIMKLFRQHRDIFDVFYLVKCDKCKFTTKINSQSSKSKCDQCSNLLKKRETNFFVYIPIEQQIAKAIKESIVFVTKNVDNDNSHRDACDGSILKGVLEQYQDSDVNILSLCLNLDGANKFKSNVLSVWPIQVLQNYLPPDIRFLPSNIIVAGLYYNTKKPNCYDFMMPLIKELNDLHGKTIIINIEDVDYKFKPVITHCGVDLPAKSMLQETKQYGSYYGCSYCDIPGESVFIEIRNNSDDEENNKMNKKTKKKCLGPKKFVRYVEGDEKHSLRDEGQTLETMLSVSESKTGEPVDGIKGVSCLVGLKHFNIIWSFGVEYMHACLLGVMKRFFNFFCNSKFHSKHFYIKPQTRATLSQQICAIKPPSYVTRKPRCLGQRKNFKASEYRSMLLYYLPVCLPGSIPNEFVRHIRIFSAAVYTLLKTNISRDEIDEAEKMLNRFVKQHQDLFGKANMVMVVHLMKHLTESVRKLGPLWCHSAFPFERNNGCLLRLANGTTDVLHQLSSKYSLSKSLNKKIELKKDKHIFRGRSIEIKEKSLKVVNMDGNENYDFSNIPLNVFKRIQLNKIIFTSSLYTKPKKTIDYFIGLTDETVGMARFYFEHNNEIFVVIEKFEEIDYIHHITKVQKTNTMVMAPVDEINEKYIYMKVGINQYIVTPPNPYEKE